MQVKLNNIFNKTIVILTLSFVFFSLIFTSVYSEKDGFNFKNALPIISVAFLIYIVSFLLFKIIDKFDKTKLKWLAFSLMAVFVAIEIFVLFNLSSVPNTDAYRCIDTAIGFATGVEESVSNNSLYYNYFCAFSNNNMFVSILDLYFSFLKLFNVTDFLFFARVLNAILIFLAIVFTFLSINKLLGLKMATKTLVLLTLCPVFYVFIEWVYTLTFSLAFMMALFYVLVCLTKAKTTSKRILLSIICALLAVVSYLIRPTAIFPLIAFILVALFKFKTKDFKKYLVCFVSFILVFAITYSPLSDFANNKFQDTLDKNHPVTHWVMMGLGENGGLSYDDYALTKSFGDTKAEKTKGNLQEIGKRIKEKGAIGLAKHFCYKTLKTFTSGTFGIHSRISHQQENSTLKPFIEGKNDLFFLFYAQGFRTFIYLFMMILLIKILVSKKNNSALMPIIITVLGGYVFYLIWEAKQTYSLAFYIFTIILAQVCLNDLSEKISLDNKVFKRIKLKNLFCFALGLTLCLSLITGIYLYDDYCEKEIITKNIQVEKIVKKYGHSQTAKSLNQEFFIKDDFDYIKLYIYKSDLALDDKINVTLKDERQNIINSTNINYGDFSKNGDIKMGLINFDKVSTNNKAKYILSINCDKNINWLVSNSNGIDVYKGDLTIDNKKVCNDLSIEVGQEIKTTKMPKAIYFLIWFDICLTQILLVLSLLIERIKNKLYFI